MKTTRTLLALGASALVLSLAGCWGDNDDDPVAEAPPNAAVPASAGVSAAAFISFLMTLSASDESSEPLTLTDTFAVPPENSAEPIPLT